MTHPKKRPETPAHVISRRGFLGLVAAVAVVRPDRKARPDPRLLRPKVRWIGHL